MKIIVMTYDKNYNVVTPLFNALIAAGHELDIFNDSDATVTDELIQTYSVFMAVLQRNNYALIKNAIDNGVPTIITMSYNSSNPAQIAEMFNARESQYGMPRTTIQPIVTNGIIPFLDKIDLYDDTARNIIGFYDKSVMAPGGEVLAQLSKTDERVAIAVFERGSTTTKGGMFNARCAYAGYGHAYTYSNECIETTLSLIRWVTDTHKKIQGEVCLHDMTPVSRQVVAYRRDTLQPIFSVQSDENGKFSGFKGDYDCFAVALDESGGTKNAVIIDKI